VTPLSRGPRAGRLRGVLLGHGHMGAFHARRLAERGDVALTVLDPAQGLHGPLPGALDFAVIATPTSTHADLARPLLDRGVPCLIEKPLAATLAEARLLAAYPHLSVGHVERWNPTLSLIAGCRPRFFVSERLAPYPARGTDVDVISDLLVHDLDLACLLLPGPLRDLRAVGVGVLSGVTDIVNVRLELGAAVAQLSASRVSREPVRKLRLFEDGQYWSLDLLHRAAFRSRWGQGEQGVELQGEPLPVPAGDALQGEHAAFLAAVRGEAPYPVPGPEALAVLELAEQVRGALSSGA
jgi:predicted dehydrogenase